MGDQYEDIVAVVANVSAEQMLDGYHLGRFAMPYVADVYMWMSPKRRGVLPLDNLRVTRSLRKSAKHYTVTFDAAFDEVLRCCAGRGREGDWITQRLFDNYRVLHSIGAAHSVEAWDADGRLSGGLFLVNVGTLISGESMFHFGRDASKVALLALVDRLRGTGQRVLFDVQWRTDHLASLGVVEIPRKQYLALLPEHVNRPDLL